MALKHFKRTDTKILYTAINLSPIKHESRCYVATLEAFELLGFMTLSFARRVISTYCIGNSRHTDMLYRYKVGTTLVRPIYPQTR